MVARLPQGRRACPLHGARSTATVVEAVAIATVASDVSTRTRPRPARPRSTRPSGRVGPAVSARRGRASRTTSPRDEEQLEHDRRAVREADRLGRCPRTRRRAGRPSGSRPRRRRSRGCRRCRSPSSRATGRRGTHADPGRLEDRRDDEPRGEIADLGVVAMARPTRWMTAAPADRPARMIERASGPRRARWSGGHAGRADGERGRSGPGRPRSERRWRVKIAPPTTRIRAAICSTTSWPSVSHAGVLLSCRRAAGRSSAGHRRGRRAAGHVADGEADDRDRRVDDVDRGVGATLKIPNRVGLTSTATKMITYRTPKPITALTCCSPLQPEGDVRGPRGRSAGGRCCGRCRPRGRRPAPSPAIDVLRKPSSPAATSTMPASVAQPIAVFVLLMDVPTSSMRRLRADGV